MIKDELTQKLKDAREARQVSLQDAARILSLRPLVLQDLEDGNFERLGALIYIKSYTRKYADYLKIDRAEIEALLSQLEDPFKQQRDESVVRAHMNEEKRMVNRSFFKWYSVILMIVLVVAVVVYFIYGEKVTDIFHVKSTPDHIVNYQEDNEQPEQEINQTSEFIMSSSVQEVASNTLPPLDLLTANREVDAEEIIDSVKPVVTNIAPSVDTRSALSEFEVDQIIRTGQLNLSETVGVNSEPTITKPLDLPKGVSSLSITLNASECWLQIKDKNQKILMNEVLPGGATYHVEGEAPFALHFGNVQSVDKLVLNGEMVDQKVYRPTPKTTVSKIKLESKEES